MKLLRGNILLVDSEGNEKLDSSLIESIYMYLEQIDRLTCNIFE